MPIWQLCANLLIPNCLRPNLSYSPLAALELYVNSLNAKSFVLKKLLNDEMASNHKDSESLNQKCADFTRVIDFIYENFGEEAFFNLQKDLQKIRRRLYPTVYDSLMIATSIALSRGFEKKGDLITLRMNLLKDEEYRESITQGTMQVDHIKTRVQKSLSIIYGMEL